MPVMNEDQVSAAGAALFAAERDRSQTRLISAAHSGMDMDDAYAVQADFVARKLAAGGSIRGWKIGLTSKAMQYALNIDIPDSGVLFEDMFFDHGGTVPAGRFIEPRIEAEIAFIMDSDLAGAEVSGADVISRLPMARRYSLVSAVMSSISTSVERPLGLISKPRCSATHSARIGEERSLPFQANGSQALAPLITVVSPCCCWRY